MGELTFHAGKTTLLIAAANQSAPLTIWFLLVLCHMLASFPGPAQQRKAGNEASIMSYWRPTLEPVFSTSLELWRTLC